MSFLDDRWNFEQSFGYLTSPTRMPKDVSIAPFHQDDPVFFDEEEEEHLSLETGDEFYLFGLQ